MSISVIGRWRTRRTKGITTIYVVESDDKFVMTNRLDIEDTLNSLISMGHSNFLEPTLMFIIQMNVSHMNSELTLNL